MIIASIKPSSYESVLQFHYINSESKDVEICSHEANDIGLEKADILCSFDSAIEKKNAEIKELESKKKYFIKMFGRYFGDHQKD